MKLFYQLSLAAVVSLSAVSAQAVQTPNFYECSGKNVNLTLVVGSNSEVGIVAPTTSLNLSIGRKNYSFQGEEVTTESTLIGDLYEVTLNFIPDLKIEHASVLIPAISMGEAPVDFKSKLILTKVNTPFAPTAFEGVINPSRFIDIGCQASFVYF